jgi:ATP-dependent Clp protease ATP-binding subunit ClpC
MQARYEKHHRCMYSAEAVNAAVTLSTRYIADRQLPDKAIDLLDEAGSRARIAAFGARRAALERALAGSGGLPGAGGGGQGSLGPWQDLQQVLEAKEEAVKVRMRQGFI